ncbi:MAG: PKD domain-containing protein, partial [Candidatus Cloacimonetes bacterium]|nr:PKD domain-containing protein [Candidatus Cloacimonadota bacterium]
GNNTTNVNNSLIFNNKILVNTGSQIIPNNVIFSDPNFMGQFDDNIDESMWEYYYLHDSSPAIDAGIDVSDMMPLGIDLAGNYRISGNSIDMGAFEFQGLTARFSAEPRTGTAPLEVQFTDLSSGGNVFAWAWDFNSDGNVDSSEQHPVFIYEENGNYTVTLTINNGEASITMPNFIIVSDIVNVDFTADPLIGTAPLAVQFIDLSIGAVSWAWDFGITPASSSQTPTKRINNNRISHVKNIDSTEQNPVFIFEEEGEYTITLTINDGESSNTKPDFIIVTQAAKADFKAEPTTGTAPLEVQFTCLSTGAFAWKWDFNNDGTVDSTEQNPIFTYLTSGIYTVTLIINNGEDTITKQDFIDSTVSEDDETVLPFTGVNLQSYPNPVNISRSSNTLISFNTQTKAASEPVIEIYNIRGQKIRTLRTGMSFYDLAVLAGLAQENLDLINSRNYSVIWDMRDDNKGLVGSGIYFYRAIVDGEIVGTNRMVVIK